MEAKDEEILEDACGSVGVEDALFHRECRETRDIFAFANGDADVLMPGDVPVGLFDLVEENGSHSEALRAQDFFGGLTEAAIADQRFYEGREEKEIAAIWRRRRELVLKSGKVIGAEAGREDVVTICFEAHRVEGRAGGGGQQSMGQTSWLGPMVPRAM